MFGDEIIHPKVGIVGGCRLINAVFNKERNVLDFTFKQPNGSEVLIREFDANPGYGDVKVQKSRISARIGHIVRSTLEGAASAEEYSAAVGKTESWEEYVQKNIDFLSKYPYNTFPLRVKFVYTKKGFPTLPKLVKEGIVEREDLYPTTSMVIDKAWDIVVRPQPDAEPAEGEKKDDLPF